MEPHHMNGSLGSGDIDGLPKVSVYSVSSLTASTLPQPRGPRKLVSPSGGTVVGALGLTSSLLPPEFSEQHKWH